MSTGGATKTTEWQACVKEDTGAGPRNLKKRTEELAAQVERPKRDRARADEAASVESALNARPAQKVRRRGGLVE